MAAKKQAKQAAAQQPAPENVGVDLAAPGGDTSIVHAGVPTLALAQALPETTDGQPVEALPGGITRFADTDERTMAVVHVDGVLHKQALAEEVEG